MVGQAEDEIRVDAEDALGAIDGLEVRRVFSGWGFYRRGLLFAAAWDGEFRFRARRDGRWTYEAVDREMLSSSPDELVDAARKVLAELEAEPAATTRKRRSTARHRGPARP
jgi:TfoX/Sxy family transcriptional regulator of competence genes